MLTLALALRREELVLRERMRLVGAGMQVGVDVGHPAPRRLGRENQHLLFMDSDCHPCWELADRLRGEGDAAGWTAVISGDEGDALKLAFGVTTAVVTGLEAEHLARALKVVVKPIAVSIRGGTVRAVGLPYNIGDLRDLRLETV